MAGGAGHPPGRDGCRPGTATACPTAPRGLKPLFLGCKCFFLFFFFFSFKLQISYKKRNKSKKHDSSLKHPPLHGWSLPLLPLPTSFYMIRLLFFSSSEKCCGFVSSSSISCHFSAHSSADLSVGPEAGGGRGGLHSSADLPASEFGLKCKFFFSFFFLMHFI